MERDLDKILDIDPLDVVSQSKSVVKSAQTNVDLLFQNEQGLDERFFEDFEEVKTGVKEIIKEIRDCFHKLSLIAQDTEKASHFSALAQLTKVLADLNKQLIELYDIKKTYITPSRNSKSDGNTPPMHINNAIFTGTTADLLRTMNELKQKGN